MGDIFIQPYIDLNRSRNPVSFLMSSPLTFLGLQHASPNPLTAVPSRAPYYFMFHFIYGYGVLASRTYKQYLGIDNQASPRQDSGVAGEKAVQEGKISRAQLDRVKRFEAASANSVENYTLFVASVLSAQIAGIDGLVLNRCMLSYTLARLAYGYLYVTIEDNRTAHWRGHAWWWGNISCLYLLWKAGRNLVIT